MAPFGLENLGNTCYMNSVLQSLRASERFVELFEDSAVSDSDTSRLCSATRRFFRSSATDRIYSPQDILSLSGRLHPQFATYDQQDAHEWLRFIFARLEKFPSVDLFRVSFRSTIECESCGGVFPTDETSLDVSLSIPGEPEKTSLSWFSGIFSRSSSASSTTAVSLDDCIREFQKT